MDLGKLLPSSFVLLFKQLVLLDYQANEKMGEKRVSQIILKRINLVFRRDIELHVTKLKLL